MTFIDTLRADDLNLMAHITVEDPDHPGTDITGKVFKLEMIDPRDDNTLIRVFILRDDGSVAYVDLPQHTNVILNW